MAVIADKRTLEEAKQWLREQFNNGECVPCPCCDQDVKLYKRSLNSSMALALICFYRYFQNNPNEEWLFVPAYLKQNTSGSTALGGDYAKLRYWGLIEDKKGVRDDGSKRIGYYRLTDAGREFVNGRTRVPKYVYIYNEKQLRRPVSEDTDIREALGEKFNYGELMAPL